MNKPTSTIILGVATLAVLGLLVVRSCQQSIIGPSTIPVSHNDKILGDALEMDALLLQMIDELDAPDPVVEALFDMADDMNKNQEFKEDVLDWARIISGSYPRNVVEWVRDEQFVSFDDVANNPTLSEHGNWEFRDGKLIDQSEYPRLAALAGHWEMVYEELTQPRNELLDYLVGSPSTPEGFEDEIGKCISDPELSSGERIAYALVLAAVQRQREATERAFMKWLGLGSVAKEQGYLIQRAIQAEYMAPPGEGWWADGNGSDETSPTQDTEPRTWDDLFSQPHSIK